MHATFPHLAGMRSGNVPGRCASRAGHRKWAGWTWAERFIPQSNSRTYQSKVSRCTSLFLIWQECALVKVSQVVIVATNWHFPHAPSITIVVAKPVLACCCSWRTELSVERYGTGGKGSRFGSLSLKTVDYKTCKLKPLASRSLGFVC